jgi:hypothetical protein
MNDLVDDSTVDHLSTNRLIDRNLQFMQSNFRAGMGGLILYPSIHLLTSFPIAPYSIVCYGAHYIHILQCLQNIALTRRFDTYRSKYINYFPFSNTTTYSDTRQSIYSLKLNALNDRSSLHKFWWCDTIQPHTLSAASQQTIHQVVEWRDTMTRSIISNYAIALVGCKLLGWGSGLGFFMGSFFSVVYGVASYIDKPLIKIDDVIMDCQTHNTEKKRYMYINTFGSIVLTNYKYGLYKRWPLQLLAKN